jgi:tetratricopeptide (TPR) repeat protein
MGTAYQIKGNYHAASFYYNEALRVSPTYQNAINARDYLKKNLGLDIHINPLTTNMDTTANDKNSNYYYELGNYYASRGNYQQAAENFKQSIGMDSATEGSYINLANCYGMLKDYNKSIIISELLLRRNPNNVQALENLSVTYKMLGNNNKAEEYSVRAKALKK